VVEFSQKKSLVDWLKAVINTIDNPDVECHCSETNLVDEDRNNYEKFYEKTSECILKY
jgi:hypothetical protein